MLKELNLKKEILIEVKILLKKLLKIIYYPFIRIVFNKFSFRILNLFSVSELSNKELFVTYHMRPKTNFYVSNCFDQKKLYSEEKIGIIIQGGIHYKDNFTLETVKYYKKILPESKIVVSTWEDEDKETLKKIEAEGVKIITSKKPTIKGFSNNNLQIVSTQKAIEFLDSINMKYILKSRTDQRIYYERFIQYFINLLNNFPIGKNSINQIERIIVLNTGTCIDIPFLITDMMQFGNIEDMKKMWFIPLQNKTVDIKKFYREPVTPLDIFNAGGSELYIINNFLKNLSENNEFSYKNHFEILKNRFIVVDKSNIDLFWYKYDGKEFPNIEYRKCQRLIRINFSDWNNLYNSKINPYEIDENKINELIK